MKLRKLMICVGIAGAVLASWESVLADDYQALKGVDCYIKASEISWTADQFMEGSGIKLLCEEQSVGLVDGKANNGWLATNEFGKIRLKTLGNFTMVILVTPKQNASLRERYNK